MDGLMDGSITNGLTIMKFMANNEIGEDERRRRSGLR